MTTIKNLSASPPQEDLEASFDPPCQSIEETKESCTTFDGEQPLEPDIKEFQTCLSSNHVCTSETYHPIVEDLHGKTKKEVQGDLKE